MMASPENSLAVYKYSEKATSPEKIIFCHLTAWISKPHSCLWQMKQCFVNFISGILFPLQQEAKTTSKHTSPTEASDLSLRWRLRHVTWKRNPNVDINCLNRFLFCSSQTSQFFEESQMVWYIRQNTNIANV